MNYLLWHYLAESCSRFTQRPAIVSRTTVMSYQELDDLSDRLARVLVAGGVTQLSRVAIYHPKSPKSIVAMLGVLKAGGVYVPIDPKAPPARASYILKDCSVTALIATQDTIDSLSDHLGTLESLRLVVVTEGDPAVVPFPAEGHVWSWSDVERAEAGAPTSAGVETDPAYILYTSGSTGKPKGVILSQRNARAFVNWAADTVGVMANDRLSNHAPLHFDLSVFDIYAAIRCGASVVLVPDQLAPFPFELSKWIESERITVWYSVPSALVRLLLAGGMDRFEYQGLRAVLYAGEPFPVKYLRELMTKMKHSVFYNLYGPTETNVCTYYRLPRELPVDWLDVPIGEACSNTKVFAVKDDGELVSEPGQTGELFVRGPTVMLGYWNLPGRTDKALIKNQFRSEYDERVYRTGDIVRLGQDGTYTFVGRRDSMIKSRGYRIELGEIEQVLLSHEGIQAAAGVAVPDPE